MRFRPIIMTSFAFILGVVPLVWATGAGAASRQSLGTAVFGGMLTATFLAVFFVPVFFVAVQHLIELRNGPPKPVPGTYAAGHAAELAALAGAAPAGGGHANGPPGEPMYVAPAPVPDGSNGPIDSSAAPEHRGEAR